ncbi:hypothetical protein B0H13DRAFT_1873168 [Mycena leptocephala]|nr:hypothetical protein B0H13DRAFT_1873168 [Mycena leptocephala]
MTGPGLKDDDPYIISDDDEVVSAAVAPSSNSSIASSTASAVSRYPAIPIFTSGFTSGARIQRSRPLRAADLMVNGVTISGDRSCADDSFKCAICWGLKSHPVVTTCCHTFCFVCIRISLETSFQCPFCREQILGPPVRSTDFDNVLKAAYPNQPDNTRFRNSVYEVPFKNASRELILSSGTPFAKFRVELGQKMETGDCARDPPKSRNASSWFIVGYELREKEATVSTKRSPPYRSGYARKDYGGLRFFLDVEMVLKPLTLQTKVMLQQHQRPNGVRLQARAPKGYSVSSTREHALHGDGRAWIESLARFTCEEVRKSTRNRHLATTELRVLTRRRAAMNYSGPGCRGKDSRFTWDPAAEDASSSISGSG